MKYRDSTPILSNFVGAHPRNIHAKFEANPCSRLREEDDDGHREIARVTLTHRV